MTAPFSARRRAEEFDALVSGASSTTPRPPLTERDAERFADLLAVVDDLRAVPEVVPRPAFTAALRERLMLEADTVLVAQTARARAEEARLVLPTRPRARDRRLATLLGGAALIGATTSMAVAAQTALPGDSLYPVKRAIEDARTGLANDDADRGARLLAHAGGRLDEVDELARTSAPLRSAAVADTLVTFDEQATEAAEVLLEAYAESGDEQVIRSLRSFAATGLDQLSTLEGRIPDSARDELVAAGRTLAEIDARAAAACPECGGDAATLPPFLLTASAQGLDVGSVLSASTSFIVDRGRTGQPAIGATISGQDVGGIVVPDLDTTVAGGTGDDPRTAPAVARAVAPAVSRRPPRSRRPAPGRRSRRPSRTSRARSTTSPSCSPATCPRSSTRCPSSAGRPVVGGTLGGVVGGAGDTLDQTTDSLLD